MDAAHKSPVHDQQSRIHWPSVWQFGLSGLAIFNLWSGAISLVLLGFVDRFINSSSFADALPMFMMAAATAVSGLLLLPSASYALLRIVGRKARSPISLPRGLHPSLLIFAFPVVLLLGYWVATISNLAWLLLPWLHVFAIGLPVLWLIYLGVRDLPLGSPQRMWGVFGSGLVLGPSLILMAEFAVLLAFILVGVFIIAGQPELVQELEYLVDWLANASPTPEMVMERLAPYLMQPNLIFMVFAFGAVIVPLVEEMIKPIGVWLLIGRGLTPAAGFAAGVLSGAGYALFESLALASSGGQEWATLVIARIGTAVIHILTTGLTGWALVMAWRKRRYVLLGVTYLVAVLIHSLWNGLTLLNAFVTLSEEVNAPQAMSPLVSRLGEIAPYGLGVLAILFFFALLWANRVVASAYMATVQVDQETPADRLADNNSLDNVL